MVLSPALAQMQPAYADENVTELTLIYEGPGPATIVVTDERGNEHFDSPFTGLFTGNSFTVFPVPGQTTFSEETDFEITLPSSSSPTKIVATIDIDTECDDDDLELGEVEKDNGVIGKALGDVLPVLKQETPPESGESCDWCAWFKRRQTSKSPVFDRESKTSRSGMQEMWA